jgi:5-formaminoimidazole-4-carboxamide-1-(beta)-D-ribofuranosyl 5'-monophosphate synthetase
MKKKNIIATLGSHSSLQILKGAKDEGFQTLIITTKAREKFYRRFPFIDEFLVLENYQDFFAHDAKLKKDGVILIPHGTFVAYLGIEGNKKIHTPYFGNKKVLDWEADRNKQIEWLTAAKINIPKIFQKGDKIDRPVIVKSFGAAGGAGYFVANDQKDFDKKIKNFSAKEYLVQEYLVGVPMYLHYFYSPLTKEVELLSIDRRYETNVDAIGRVPMQQQEAFPLNPSFVVVGNSPLVVRESMLPDAYEMAERFIAASQKLISDRGIFGPFCIETIVTPEMKFYAVEASCRIVAGTNVFIDSSPYASLIYDEPMSTGRRIAREIKLAIKQNKLAEILD